MCAPNLKFTPIMSLHHEALHIRQACMLQVVVKYQLDKPPKLVEIIAAVPEEHRATLLPQYVYQ